MDESATSGHRRAPFNGVNCHGGDAESGPDPYVQFLENWIPGIGECTELHDKLHDHFGLDFSVNSEALDCWDFSSTTPPAIFCT